jgi:hypothetical protein
MHVGILGEIKNAALVLIYTKCAVVGMAFVF